MRSAIVFFAAAALAPLVVSDAFLLDSLVLILIWGSAAGAWNIARGYAGQISLGHSAFFGLGAYAAALCGVRWNISPWFGLLIGAAAASAAGMVIGFLANRLRGPYFVIATIAVSQVLLLGASRWRGFQLAAVREDEDAALSLGVPARRLKVAAIALSAAFTAVCGALWAQYVGFVDPLYVFSIDLSIRFSLAAIIGGLGSALGPFLGAVLVTTVETWLRAQFGGLGSHLVGLYLILYGVALIVMVRYAPQGLVGWIRPR